MMAPPSSSLALGGGDRESPAAVADIGGCINNNNKHLMKRENIKSKSTKSQWKEKLRAECISRAKDARREKIRQARRSSSNDDNNNCCHRGDVMGVASSTIASSTVACSSNIYESRDAPSITAMKRSRDMMVQHNNNSDNTYSSSNNDQYQRMVDHTPMDYNENHHHILSSSSRQISHGGVSDVGVIDTARMLVEHELQRALTGLQHCEQIQQGAPLCKKTYHGLGGGGNNYLGSDEDMQQDDNEEEYKITEQEFDALLAEVTDELQREEELLEEELWEMERADALERERLLHQIDDYDDWEELKQQEEQQQQQQQSWGNVYTSPLLTNMKSRVTCPICNSASLMETPFDGIQCTNATDATTNDNKKQCPFALDIAHEGLTLNHLENQLRTVYEEHSAVCLKGVLSFRVDCRGGINMLMASCDDCQADVVVL